MAQFAHAFSLQIHLGRGVRLEQLFVKLRRWRGLRSL
jgi:hypothetical protein